MAVHNVSESSPQTERGRSSGLKTGSASRAHRPLITEYVPARYPRRGYPSARLRPREMRAPLNKSQLPRAREQCAGVPPHRRLARCARHTHDTPPRQNMCVANAPRHADSAPFFQGQQCPRIPCLGARGRLRSTYTALAASPHPEPRARVVPPHAVQIPSPDQRYHQRSSENLHTKPHVPLARLVHPARSTSTGAETGMCVAPKQLHSLAAAQAQATTTRLRRTCAQMSPASPCFSVPQGHSAEGIRPLAWRYGCSLPECQQQLWISRTPDSVYQCKPSAQVLGAC